MNIQPLKEKVLVQPKIDEDRTAGGIYIPESAKEKTQEGTVIAVGPCEDCEIKVGNKVIFESFAGTEIKINGKKHLIMNVKDILATFE